MATLPNPLPKLAADPSGRSLGLSLPPGSLIDTTVSGPWHEPLLWCAEQRALPGDWAALAPARRVGLLPVLVDAASHGGPRDWDLTPDEVSYPGDHDVEEVLAEGWAEYAAADGEEWPGLATALPLTADPDAHAASTADELTGTADQLPQAPAWLKDPRLALVPARRSADILAALGWSGPMNYESDVARQSAVLRSWEDRFGIRVVALGLDHLTVSVAAPPTGPAEAGPVAAEHFAFCPDNAVQCGDSTLDSYARELAGKRVWQFWWD